MNDETRRFLDRIGALHGDRFCFAWSEPSQFRHVWEYHAEAKWVSVHEFAQHRRSKDTMLPSCWVGADLDRAAPPGDCVIPPTLLVESSPGNYQAWWQLTERVDMAEMEALSHAVATYMGADVGSWIASKLLRIPGTTNEKYPDLPHVTLIEDGHTTYSPEWMLKALRSELGPEYQGPAQRALTAPLPDDVIGWERRLELLLVGADGDTQELWRTPMPKGARYRAQWLLGRALLELGATPADVAHGLWSRPWNKYHMERRSFEDQWLEVQRMQKTPQLNPPPIGGEQVYEDSMGDMSDSMETPPETTPVTPNPLLEFYRRPVVCGAELVAAEDLPEPPWLVEGMVASGSKWLIVGEPKSFKSTLTMDLAFSVATGTEFLGSSVPTPGLVIYVDSEMRRSHFRSWLRRLELNRFGDEAEDSRDRWANKLLHFKWPSADTWANQSGRDKLARNIAEIVQQVGEQPRLVVFDSLYLFASGTNLNDMGEITPLLKLCDQVWEEYDCTVGLVHHANKPRVDSEGGFVAMSPEHRILGSTALRSWYSTFWFLEDRGALRIKLIRNFREQAAPDDVLVQLAIDQDEELYEAVMLEGSADLRLSAVEQQMLGLLAEAGGEMPEAEIAVRLGRKRDRITTAARRLCSLGFMERSGGGTGGRGRKVMLTLVERAEDNDNLVVDLTEEADVSG